MAPLLRVFPSLLLPVLALVRPISSSRILREGLVERRFEAELDHFGFGPPPEGFDGLTMPIRYFVDETWFDRDGGGPVFFYAGNEAPIEQFIDNTGFMFEIAEEFGAMVVFAEHRYYGESLPRLKNASDVSDGDALRYLTVEQAMADFTDLAVEMRGGEWELDRSANAFVAFGGSYGANLAMWMRLRNPNVWAGAIASSATPRKRALRESNAFARIYTEAYGNRSAECPDLVRAGWSDLYEKCQTADGRREAAGILGICDADADDVRPGDVHGWVGGALETMVQYGYPYPTEFYNPVPAFPFRVACDAMVESGTGLGALRAAADVYYNHTGRAGPCYDLESDVAAGAEDHLRRSGRHDLLTQLEDRRDARRTRRRQAGKTLRGEQRVDTDAADDRRSYSSWGYQTCTEVYQPMPTDGVTDFETPYAPNETAYFERCRRRFGVVPRPDWEETTFGGPDVFAFAGEANVFLASGQLDPWRAGGITDAPEALDGSDTSIEIRVIEDGAHHLDLRESHPADPPSVVEVRREEKAAIRRWILEWRELYGSGQSRQGGEAVRVAIE